MCISFENGAPGPNSIACGGFPTPASNSQTSAGYPRIQLSSDTSILETESGSKGEGLGPQAALHFRGQATYHLCL